MEPFGRSRVRREIADLFLSEPGLETHPRELARRLGHAAPPVVRELRGLEERGLLVSRPVGPLKRYRLAGGAGSSLGRSGDPSGHDERLLRLHALVAQKLREDPERILAKAFANLERWQHLDPRGNEPWIRAWSEILKLGPDLVAAALVDGGERMRELRQSSPFAGVLTVGERLRVIRDDTAARAGR